MASKLAKHGRFGDDMLLHVNRHEVKGLEALNGGRPLPRNPQTGMPEAFGLGDILGIVGSIAGMVLAPEIGVSTALAGGLGGGLGQFAGSGDLGKGIVSGLLGYGLGSAGGMLAEAGAGSAAGEAAAQQLAQNGVQAAEMATPASMAGDITNPASGVFGGYGGYGGQAAGAALPQSLTQQGAEAIAQSAVNAAGPVPAAGLGFGQAGINQMGNAAKGLTDPSALWNTFGKNALSTTAPIGLGIYGSSLSDNPTATGVPQQQLGSSYPTVPGPNQRQYRPLPKDWDYSKGKEWNYFTPAFADGGPVDDLPPYVTPGYMAESQFLEDQKMDDLLKQFGALRDHAIDEQDQRNRDVTSPNPFHRRRNPEVRFAMGGGISGPGGGIADAVPAVIDGQEPAKLSSGEYVVPAHAVSAIGDGSSEHGIRQLDNMVNQVMQHKYGTKNRQPRPMANMKKKGLAAYG